MRRKIKVESYVTEYQCDFCDTKSCQNHGYAGGSAPITSCYVCHKDICRKHRYTFVDEHDTGDYPSSIDVCLSCKPIVQKVFDEEIPKLQYGDDLFYKVEGILRNMNKNEKG